MAVTGDTLELFEGQRHHMVALLMTKATGSGFEPVFARSEAAMEHGFIIIIFFILYIYSIKWTFVITYDWSFVITKDQAAMVICDHK